MLLELNGQDVVHEVIDDELVLLNLRSGAYYSGNRTATALLELLLAGTDAAALLDAVDASSTTTVPVAERSGAPTEGARPVLEAAIAYLLAEGLLHDAASDARPSDGSSEPDRARIQELVDLLADDPPLFEKFTDMRDILLLDPVHDVDDRGWPWQPGAGSDENLRTATGQPELSGESADVT
jgi:hypothetical protein